jgi:hypothetical protein
MGLFTNIAGIVHLVGLFTMYSLPILFRNKISYTLFILVYTLTPISWMLCKDECFISYFVKKFNNPEYKLGDSPDDYNDIIELVNDKYRLEIVYTAMTTVELISLFIVQQSTPKINPLIFFIVAVLRTLYGYDISWKMNIRKDGYPYIQGITMFSFLLLLYQYFK